MKNEKKNVKSAAFLTGALLTGSLAGFNSATAGDASLFEYEALGTGAEVRTELLNSNNSLFNASDALNNTRTIMFSELKGGEGKCGEGKCGEDKKDHKDKDAKSKDKKTSDSDSDPDKEKSGDKKKSTAKKDDKTSESKCGEGKCG